MDGRGPPLRSEVNTGAGEIVGDRLRPAYVMARTVKASRRNCSNDQAPNPQPATLLVSTVSDAVAVAQHETLDFSGGGLRQAVDEFNPARILPGAYGTLHVHFE